MGDLADGAGKHATRIGVLEEQVEIERQLVADTATSVEDVRRFAGSLEVLAGAHRQHGDCQAELAVREELLVVCSKVASVDPGNLSDLLTLARATHELAGLLERARRFARARTRYEHLSALNRHGMALAPCDLEWRQRVALSLTDEARALRMLKQPREARKVLEEALGIGRQLIRGRWNVDFMKTLLFVLGEAAGVEQDRGEVEFAMELMRELAQHARALLKVDSDDRLANAKLGHALCSLAEYDWAEGRVEEARRGFVEAVSCLRRRSSLQPPGSFSLWRLCDALQGLIEVETRLGHCDSAASLRAERAQVKARRAALASESGEPVALAGSGL